MGVEIVLSLGFSDIGPERESPGVLDQRGPNGGGPGERPRKGEEIAQGRGVRGRGWPWRWGCRGLDKFEKNLLIF